MATVRVNIIRAIRSRPLIVVGSDDAFKEYDENKRVIRAKG